MKYNEICVSGTWRNTHPVKTLGMQIGFQDAVCTGAAENEDSLACVHTCAGSSASQSALLPAQCCMHDLRPADMSRI